MKKQRLSMLAGLLAIALTGAAVAQEVERQEVLRLGNFAQRLGDGRASAADEQYLEVMGPPADDHGKWFISVVGAQGCPACARLRADLGRDQHLRALVHPDDPQRSWSHFNWYYREDRSQAFRWEQIKFGGYPTILVQPPLNKQYGDPATVVFQSTGYDGDGRKLAGKITAAIKAYLAKRSAAPRTVGYRRTVPNFGDDRVGVDPPWAPAPRVEPLVTPPPAPAPPVDIPVIPPVDIPRPAVDEQVATYPEAVVVTDADDGLDAATDDRVRSVLAALRTQRGKNLKLRFVDWRDAQDRFPVRRDELPVILVTNDGRIEDKISGRLLPFLQTEPKQVTLADIPWPAILTLVTTGFSLPAAIALGVWAVRFIRSRRQAAGKPALLSDASLEQILAVVQKWLEARNPPPAPPPPASG